MRTDGQRLGESPTAQQDHCCVVTKGGGGRSGLRLTGHTFHEDSSVFPWHTGLAEKGGVGMWLREERERGTAGRQTFLEGLSHSLD